jgi:hypothetical protein
VRQGIPGFHATGTGGLRWPRCLMIRRDSVCAIEPRAQRGPPTSWGSASRDDLANHTPSPYSPQASACGPIQNRWCEVRDKRRFALQTVPTACPAQGFAEGKRRYRDHPPSTTNTQLRADWASSHDLSTEAQHQLPKLTSWISPGSVGPSLKPPRRLVSPLGADSEAQPLATRAPAGTLIRGCWHPPWR